MVVRHSTLNSLRLSRLLLITEAENGTFFIVFRMTCASACGESFRTRKIVSACGNSCSACGDRPCGGTSPHAEIRVLHAKNRDRCSACGGTSPHAEIVFRVRRTWSPHAKTRTKFPMLRKRQLHMIGTYTSFFLRRLCYTTCYGTPRKLLLPTDP